MKIYGVVVLYNPDESVLTNISSYLPYIDTLYAIDNSEIAEKSICNNIQALDSCIYIKNPTNLGIAAALNIAANKAIDNAATWLLTMDQDSSFNDNDCFHLINYAQGQDVNTVGIISPLQSSYVEEYRPYVLNKEPFTVITSGNLISLVTHKKVGGFNEKYFIDVVDTEYCFRLHKNQFKIKRLNNLLLQHSLGDTSVHRNVLHQTIIIRNHNKFRHFYMTRNSLDLVCKSFFLFPHFALSTLKNIFVDIKNVIFYEEQKLDKISYIGKGFIAFLTGSWGKINE